MIRTITVKLYPNNKQRGRLEFYLRVACKVYNDCLALKRGMWREFKVNVTRFDLNNKLTKWRKRNERIKDVPVKISENAIQRVNLAFQRFLNGTKSGGGKTGYPKFKNSKRYTSFEANETAQYVQNNKIRIPKLGLIRCKGLLADLPGKQKILRVLRKADGWYAQLVFDDGQKPPEKKPVREAVGIDVGLNHFTTDSRGFQVECPKYYRKLQRKLKLAQRRLKQNGKKCPKRKGSRAWKKALLRVQRIHKKIADCRSDFTHKLSKCYVESFDLIAVEDLKINNMVKNKHLSKSILDAGWSQFIQRLSYKAEEAGVTFVKVNPRGTSQECSGCGDVVKKELSVRVHKCPHCGLVLDRDENAARNIVDRAVSGLTS